MGQVMMRACGGLTSADKAKLIPQNIRYGVSLFDGTQRAVDGDAMPQKVAENSVNVHYSENQYGEAKVTWTAPKKCRAMVCIYNSAYPSYYTTYPIVLTVNGTDVERNNFIAGNPYGCNISIHDLEARDVVIASQALRTTTSHCKITAAIYII